MRRYEARRQIRRPYTMLRQRLDHCLFCGEPARRACRFNIQVLIQTDHYAKCPLFAALDRGLAVLHRQPFCLCQHLVRECAAETHIGNFLGLREEPLRQC